MKSKENPMTNAKQENNSSFVIRHSSLVTPNSLLVIRHSSFGRLYVVATPIGNLEDITLRALRVLKEVDLIACEDTRHTAKLLSHFGISKQRESFHEHNEAARTPRLLEFLRGGKNVALVSDAGTPLISDPGYRLVARCREEGIEVAPIPGPAAAVAALTGSGLPTDSFFFGGFLPARKEARKRRLEEIASVPATLVLFESPHRLLASLEDMVSVLGSRQMCLVREITKIHEEWLSGDLPEVLDVLKGRGRIQGEITLVVDRGASPAEAGEWPQPLEEHVEAEMRRTGVTRKEALKAVARQRGISRRQVYQQLVRNKNTV